jgi:hypothetical protein
LATVALLTGAAGCAVQTVPGAREAAKPLSALDPSAMQQWMEGKTDRLVLLARKGESIKLKIKGDVGFARIAAGENALEFLQDVYLCIDRKEGLLISPDGERFAPVHTPRALKKLFGKRRGTFSLRFGATGEEGTFVEIGAALK